jgi:phenylacetate-coenzyme A ligase PaaK-like adenylate-forming protein
LEFKPGIEQEREETIRRLIEELKSTYGLRMEVEVCGVGDLPQSEFKAVRFQDLRPKH